MTQQDQLKQAVAKEALKYLVTDFNNDKQLAPFGIGTGSTMNFFIDLLADYLDQECLKAPVIVSSSEQTTKRLNKHGLEVSPANMVGELAVYIDGADEINPLGAMIKGGGGALLREKIVAGLAQKFICITDFSKNVSVLGTFKLPVEVIPIARSQVARQLAKLKEVQDIHIRYKKINDVISDEFFMTDNGNLILDVVIKDSRIAMPIELEQTINRITGVVDNGLFAFKGANIGLSSYVNPHTNKIDITKTVY